MGEIEPSNRSPRRCAKGLGPRRAITSLGLFWEPAGGVSSVVVLGPLVLPASSMAEVELAGSKWSSFRLAALRPLLPNPRDVGSSISNLTVRGLVARRRRLEGGLKSTGGGRSQGMFVGEGWGFMGRFEGRLVGGFEGRLAGMFMGDGVGGVGDGGGFVGRFAGRFEGRFVGRFVGRFEGRGLMVALELLPSEGVGSREGEDWEGVGCRLIT